MTEKQPLPAKPFSTPKNTSTGCVNKVFLLGRIDGLPQLLNFEDEKQVLCFTLVTSEEFLRNEINSERQEFHQVKMPYSIMLNGAAELQPGQLVYVEGKIRTRTYFDEQLKKSYQLEIVASQVNVLL